MRAFTDAERERIRQQLHDRGRELFARYGLRKTTITELLEPIEIGTGTFYQFYDSKEELYAEILIEYGKELAPRLLEESFEAHDDPEAAIAAFLDVSMDELESNPLTNQIIIGDELARLEAQFSEGELAAERERVGDYFLPYLEQWYDTGRIAGSDPETIAHTLRAVMLLTLHEDDIGEERYPAVRDTLIAAVAAGLTEPNSGDGEGVDE